MLLPQFSRTSLWMGAIATGLALGTTGLWLTLGGNLPPAQANNRSLTGVVERVWEDGFRFRVGDRRITADTWDVCGDFTRQHIQVGDRLTIVGEFEDGEFDVFSITNAAGESVCE